MFLLDAGILGYLFSPFRSPTMKLEFEKVEAFYDSLAALQKELTAKLEDRPSFFKVGHTQLKMVKNF